MNTECDILDSTRTKVLGKMKNIRIKENYWVGDAYFNDSKVFDCEDRINVRIAQVNQTAEADVLAGVICNPNVKYLKMWPRKVSRVEFIERIRELEAENAKLKEELNSLKRSKLD